MSGLPHHPETVQVGVYVEQLASHLPTEEECCRPGGDLRYSAPSLYPVPHSTSKTLGTAAFADLEDNIHSARSQSKAQNEE